MSEHKNIPKPPGDDASAEVVAAYYEKYSPQELVEAGYFKALPKDDPGKIRRRALAEATLSKRKRAQLNIVLNEEELAELNAYAKAIHIPVSTIAKSWILRALKVEKGRISETRI